MKKSHLLVSLIFYSILVFSVTNLKVYADIDVSSWKYIGDSYQDYELKDYFASQIKGQDKIDLRKDVIYLGYRGDNIQEDVLFNGSKIPINEINTFSDTKDILIIKKMGVVDGKYIEVRMWAEQAPLDFTLSDSKTTNMINFKSKAFNMDASKYHIQMRFFYEGTNTNISSDKYFFLPTTSSNGWPAYNSAMLVDRYTKVLIGNQERDNLARTVTRTFTDNDKYRLGIGKAPESNSKYYYNYLFKDESFFYGFQGTTGFSYQGFGLFDPIEQTNSVPKPYNNLTYSNIDNTNGDVKNEITYKLPIQETNSFYPEKVVINYSKYKTSDLSMTVPTLSVDGKIIPDTSYQIDKDNNLNFNKNFLQTYAGKEVEITNFTQPDYSSERILKDYYNDKDKKFNIPYALEITSDYNDFSQVEFMEEKLTSVSYLFEFNIIDLNAEVEFGSKVTDYKPSDFLTVSSNFPNDSVDITIENLIFDKFQEKSNLTVKLRSQKLGIEKDIQVNTKVYKKIPIKYCLDTNEEISPPNNNEFPLVQKVFYNQEIRFKVPTNFDSYKFKNVQTSGFTANPTENDFYEISGKGIETLEEIILVYELSVVDVTIEFLLDGLGSYDTFKPIKIGENLNSNKKNITIETKIGENIGEFIEKNKSKIIPKIDYYKSNLDNGLISNYWHYTDQPVSEKNPSNLIDSKEKIPQKPITITTLYSGTVSLKDIDDLDFGKHKNSLNTKEIFSKNPINYHFIDTTINKMNSLNLRMETDLVNNSQEPLSAFSLEYKGETLDSEDIQIIESKDDEKNIFEGNLQSNLLFNRYWLGPENLGDFKSTLIWTISRDITT